MSSRSRQYFDSRESKAKAIAFIEQIYDALVEAGASRDRFGHGSYGITSKNPYFDLAWSDEIQSRASAYDEKYTGKIRITVSGPGARAKTFRERKDGTLNIAGIVEYAMEILEHQTKAVQRKRELEEIRALARKTIKEVAGDQAVGRWGGIAFQTPLADFSQVQPDIKDEKAVISFRMEVSPDVFKELVQYMGGVFDGSDAE